MATFPQWLRVNLTDRVRQETFALPVAEDDDRLKAAVDISGSGAHSTITSFLAQPDYPRNIMITTSDNAGDDLAGTVVINGLALDGSSISEKLTVVKAVDVVKGNKAFAKVTSVVLDFGTTHGTSDTLDIGVSNKFGLAMKAKTVLREVFNGTLQSTGTLSTTYNTYVPSGTLDGAKPLEVYYETRY